MMGVGKDGVHVREQGLKVSGARHNKGSLLYQQQAHANCMGGAKNANLHEQHVLMLSSPVMKIVMTHQRILKMITTGQ